MSQRNHSVWCRYCHTLILSHRGWNSAQCFDPQIVRGDVRRLQRSGRGARGPLPPRVTHELPVWRPDMEVCPEERRCAAPSSANLDMVSKPTAKRRYVQVHQERLWFLDFDACHARAYQWLHVAEHQTSQAAGAWYFCARCIRHLP